MHLFSAPVLVVRCLCRAQRFQPYQQLVSVQGSVSLVTIKARSGDGVGSWREVLHRPSRAPTKQDPCLRELGLQGLQRTVQSSL